MTSPGAEAVIVYTAPKYGVNNIQDQIKWD